MASRVAAELRADDGVEVETVGGGLGEFSVSLDGRKVVETSRLWYPSPGKVVRKIRSLLAE
jgi:hypothetical protein